MYCRNCANPMNKNADFCVKCGVATSKGSNYCPNCGAKTPPKADVCVKCGVALHKSVPAKEKKSKLAAALLAIFLGCLGIHNFYLGNNGKGIVQLLLTVATCGLGAFISLIWALIEGILILTGDISTDANGIPLK